MVLPIQRELGRGRVVCLLRSALHSRFNFYSIYDPPVLFVKYILFLWFTIVYPYNHYIWVKFEVFLENQHNFMKNNKKQAKKGRGKWQ